MEKAPEAFRTISEVAADLDIPQHVLRFWESRFAQIKPMKRGGGRRYYRPDDVALLRGIRHLLYGQGYTIRGVQRILREQGVRFVQSVWEEGAEQSAHSGDDAADAEAAAEETEEEQAAPVARGPVGGVRPAEPEIKPRPDAASAERHEPTFAARPQGALTPADQQALEAALAELTECQRLLDAALNEAN